MEFPTQEREVEITWNELGEATIRFAESVDGQTRITTQYGWIEPSDPDLTGDAPDSRLTVKLGRLVGHSRGTVEELPRS